MQVSPFYAVQVAVVKQPLPPVDPPAAPGQLAFVQEYEGRPEGATGRARDIADRRPWRCARSQTSTASSSLPTR